MEMFWLCILVDASVLLCTFPAENCILDAKSEWFNEENSRVKPKQATKAVKKLDLIMEIMTANALQRGHLSFCGEVHFRLLR